MKTIQHDIYLVECRECGSRYEAPYPPEVEMFGVNCRYCYGEETTAKKTDRKITVRVDDFEED